MNVALAEYMPQTARPYIPTLEASTGAFRIDQMVMLWLDRGETIAFNDVFQWLRGAQYPRLAIMDPSRGLIVHEDISRGPSVIDAQFVFGHALGTVSTPLLSLPYVFVNVPVATPLSKPAIQPRPATEIPRISADISQPYSSRLEEILQVKLWSLRRLQPILGASSTQLHRIAQGTMPSPEVGVRIDEMNRFVKRLVRMTQSNRAAMQRLLTTQSERDGKSAAQWLHDANFRRAFSAIMDAASPRLELHGAPSHALRWYDEPSIGVSDLESLRNE